MIGGRYTDRSKTEDTAVQQSSDHKTAANRPKILLAVMAAAIIGIAAVQVFLKPVIVTGTSMYPTYESGELLLTNGHITLADINYGTVIVFKNAGSGNSLYIKRVEGLPGDHIEIKNGQLVRNGEVIDEGLPLMEKAGIAAEGITIPENGFFVLGDNRNASSDSRDIGPVKMSDIKGILREQRDP